MKNPRILLIAPSSYPMYGAEANVNAKVIKVLIDAGCIVDLVCRSQNNRPNNYPLSEDEFYFGKLNSIHSVEVDTQKNLKTILLNIKTYIKTGYAYWPCEWSLGAIKVCRELIAKIQYDFIYTYDSPSELVGLYITKRYKIKWIATWNDPYVWKKYPKPYGEGALTKVDCLRRKLIADIGKYTFRNIFPSERLRDYMMSYMTNMNIDSCLISPHILLNELEQENEKVPEDTLRIIHAGALGLERDPKSMLQGFRKFLDKLPNASIEMSFLGVFERIKGDYFSDLIQEYRLDKYIVSIAPVSYADSLVLVRKFDACMLIEASCEEGIFLPSKVVDYLQNHKPIIAISPRKGVINDMYKLGTIDYFADVNDPADIALMFESLYSDFSAGTLGTKIKDITHYKNEAILNIQQQIWNG